MDVPEPGPGENSRRACPSKGGRSWPNPAPDRDSEVAPSAAIAQASGMEMRVFPRDNNLDIMNLYLSRGKFISIPVFAFFDRGLNPLCHWIERPEIATRFMESVAAELAKKKLGEEELRQEQRKRSNPMADSWRQETVKEIRDLLTEVAPKT